MNLKVLMISAKTEDLCPDLVYLALGNKPVRCVLRLVHTSTLYALITGNVELEGLTSKRQGYSKIQMAKKSQASPGQC